MKAADKEMAMMMRKCKHLLFITGALGGIFAVVFLVHLCYLFGFKFLEINMIFLDLAPIFFAEEFSLGFRGK